MSIFDNFLLSNNDNYNKAKMGLKNVKKHLECFAISFPDVTPDEIMFIKDKWELLPSAVAHGVRIMALNKDKSGVKSLLTDYRPNSYITPHRHIKEYEMDRVMRGEVINKLDGAVYGGTTYHVSVDVAPIRRVDLALKFIADAIKEATFSNPKPIEEHMAEQLMLAASNDSSAPSVKKRHELERIAQASR